ncbi:uncharacterized protein LOC111305492 [Durio zibethinus]|uniref:Uncharacterized protein LOC111305492 n=1 Tax=Durio zibethinus TaxID=66656 RepID=A0A6P6A1H9_DURZI|nr:uncharacterized protein LOC111305492 [Durio zibethinus]
MQVLPTSREPDGRSEKFFPTKPAFDLVQQNQHQLLGLFRRLRDYKSQWKKWMIILQLLTFVLPLLLLLILFQFKDGLPSVNIDKNNKLMSFLRNVHLDVPRGLLLLLLLFLITNGLSPFSLITSLILIFFSHLALERLHD